MTARRMSRNFSGWVAVIGCVSLAVQSAFAESPRSVSFQLAGEHSLKRFGGIPFCVDLDQDGRDDILWLQSPGLFHSKVFDDTVWKGRFSQAEIDHFCLTATDSNGRVLWQIGKPWNGKRPFITHCAERSIDYADIDGDGELEVVCVRRNELLVIDAVTGKIENSVKTESDNAQIVVLGHTGPKPTDWIILAKNSESAYKPHEYANPAWFYDRHLRLLKSAGFHGAGHAPQVIDIDGDGIDEFLIGFNLVDHTLKVVWTFHPVPQEQWRAGEMHVDDLAVGIVGGKKCIAYAASDTTYLLDATDGKLIWKRKGVHPQHCQMGRFAATDEPGQQVFVHNKRDDLQLFDSRGEKLWQITPPKNFPLGQAAPCKRQKFHVFDPTSILRGVGPSGTDMLIFTDRGWPYVIDGRGKRVQEFPYTKNMAQDWGEVPGRPDDYGYGYYSRIADFDGDGEPEILINDRRFAWLYEIRREDGS